MIARPIISLTGVTRNFEQGGLFGRSAGLRAVDDVSLHVAPGETLGVVGESGSGKTTLLRMVLRLLRPSTGTIEVEERDIWSLPRRDLKAFRRRIQPIFQNPASSFNPRQSIGSILAAPLEVHGIGDRRSRAGKITAVLARVGLPEDVVTRYPHQLSGGQKQRIAIARAVILEPAIVVADEPTSALDVSVQAQVLQIFQETKRAMGLTCLFVSHNLAVIRQVSDRVAVMRRGAVVEYGTVESVFAAPRHDYTRALIAAVPDPPFVDVPPAAGHHHGHD